MPECFCVFLSFTDKFPSMTRLSTEEYDQRLASISEWLTDLHKSAEVVMATWIL